MVIMDQFIFIVSVLGLIYSLWLLKRNNDVRNFLLNILQNDLHIFKLLPSYSKLLFSLKPLVLESWLTVEECNITKQEVEEAVGYEINNYTVRNMYSRDNNKYCSILIEPTRGLEAITHSFIIKPTKLDENDNNK